MQIPYNAGKTIWNKNMVCRVIENTKYIGEGGYPRIVSDKDFMLAAKIKSERNKYRKPVSQADPQAILSTEIPTTEYISTREIERMTSEIDRMLATENVDKDAVSEFITRCAQLNYLMIKEVRTWSNQ